MRLLFGCNKTLQYWRFLALFSVTFLHTQEEKDILSDTDYDSLVKSPN